MMSHRYSDPRQRRPVSHHTVTVVIKIVRDLVIFFLGAYAFYHELDSDGAVRTELLLMSGGMMGLPFIVRGDERRQEAKHNDDPEKGTRDGAQR